MTRDSYPSGQCTSGQRLSGLNHSATQQTWNRSREEGRHSQKSLHFSQVQLYARRFLLGTQVSWRAGCGIVFSGDTDGPEYSAREMMFTRWCKKINTNFWLFLWSPCFTMMAVIKVSGRRNEGIARKIYPLIFPENFAGRLPFCKNISYYFKSEGKHFKNGKKITTTTKISSELNAALQNVIRIKLHSYHKLRASKVML